MKNRLHCIRPAAVQGIQHDSQFAALEIDLKQPVLLLHGMLDDSLITAVEIERYQHMCSKLEIQPFTRSGHGIKMTEEELWIQTIERFLQKCDEGITVNIDA